MTCPRRIVPGTTYLLTRRCTQRRFTLVPRGRVPKLFGYHREPDPGSSNVSNAKGPDPQPTHLIVG